MAFAAILGLVTGLAGPISAAVTSISDLKKARVKADSDKDLKRIDQEIQAVQDRKAVLIAEAGSRIAGVLNASVRVAAAVPAIAILWKLAYDKVAGPFYGCSGVVQKPMITYCKQFSTDSLGTELALLIAAVIGFFFLTSWKRP